MTQPTVAKAHATNLETIVRPGKAEAEERVSRTNRLSAAIGKIRGHDQLRRRSGRRRGGVARHQYPSHSRSCRRSTRIRSPCWPLVLGLEAVLLTTFVLIRQNLMSLRADQRSHLDLQINLLTEREVTKVIQLVHAMSKHLGIEVHVADAETRQLGEETEVEEIARDVRKNFDEEAASAG